MTNEKQVQIARIMTAINMLLTDLHSHECLCGNGVDVANALSDGFEQLYELLS